MEHPRSGIRIIRPCGPASAETSHSTYSPAVLRALCAVRAARDAEDRLSLEDRHQLACALMLMARHAELEAQLAAAEN